MPERREATDQSETHIREMCELFGVSPEIAAQSNEWANRWRDVLVENGVDDTNDPAVLRFARDEALEQFPDITRDHNGDPSFRSSFAAQQLLYRKAPWRADAYRSALEGDGLRPMPHFDQLDSVIQTLLEARSNSEFPYSLDAAMLPQDERNMPAELERGGYDHANFLWATCYYMRGGIKSTAAFAGLSSLYRQMPELFDPKTAQNVDPEQITSSLKANSLAFSATFIGVAWVENAKRMVEHFDGDPRRIFEGTASYDEVLMRTKNRGRGRGFVGFQEKMVSMITYYLMDAELIPYFDFPLPVDFHVLRVSAANEMITFENVPEDGNIYSDQTLAILRNMYHDFSVTHGVSQLDVCNAVWSLSSAICGSQPGNIMLEPNRSEGRDGRSTHIVPLPIDLQSPKQLAMYEKTCGLCPLERSCQRNMPSKEYYVRGRAILSPRQRYEPVDGGLFADDALRRLTRKPKSS